MCAPRSPSATRFIWNDNDVEVFIGGDDCYYEFEINALGTVYEAFFVWQDALKRGSRFDRPEFDLRTRDVDLLGGFQDAIALWPAPARPALGLPRLGSSGAARAAVQRRRPINDSSRHRQGLDRGDWPFPGRA